MFRSNQVKVRINLVLLKTKGRATFCCFTKVSFWQSGNKTARAMKLGTARGSARKCFMKKGHRRPWYQQ